MEATGHLKFIDRAFPQKKATLILEADASPEVYEKYKAKDGEEPILLDIKIVKHRQKRSLTANAYYWVLCSQTADAMNSQMVNKQSVTFKKLKRSGVDEITTASLHNMMLRKAPKIVYLHGGPITWTIPDTDDSDRWILEQTEYHLMPVPGLKGQITNSAGKRFRIYLMIEGSSTLDSKEFSQLLDRMIQVAQEQGVETLPPDEIARMKAEMENR